MFVDKANIHLKAGDGGDGAVAFHREKYVAAGGPDGGDGGKGGDIIFVADTNLSTLADFRYKRKYVAKRGENGRGGRCNGKNAGNLVIKVPFGTVIKEEQTGRILADVSDKEPHVVAKGGKGGWGNPHFATPVRQVPRFAKPVSFYHHHPGAGRRLHGRGLVLCHGGHSRTHRGRVAGHRLGSPVFAPCGALPHAGAYRGRLGQ